MNCLHLIQRYEDLQDVLVDGHAEASVLTLHRETLAAYSRSASTVQPLPQSALLGPGRPHNQRIYHRSHVCGTDREETQRQPCREIKHSHVHFNALHSTFTMEIFCFHFSSSIFKRDTEDQANTSPIHEGNEKTTRVDFKMKVKCSGHSHSDGNKRHTGVLTCDAPSQLDHKAIGQVSLSVWGQLGVAALTGPHKKVGYGGQVRVKWTGQGQVRLRWVRWGHTVRRLRRERERRQIHRHQDKYVIKVQSSKRQDRDNATCGKPSCPVGNPSFICLWLNLVEML